MSPYNYPFLGLITSSNFPSNLPPQSLKSMSHLSQFIWLYFHDLLQQWLGLLTRGGFE